MAFQLHCGKNLTMVNPLNTRRVAVAEWVSTGCQIGQEPVVRYKNKIASLVHRWLIVLDNRYSEPCGR
jgi:hypothetical protein